MTTWSRDFCLWGIFSFSSIELFFFVHLWGYNGAIVIITQLKQLFWCTVILLHVSNKLGLQLGAFYTVYSNVVCHAYTSPTALILDVMVAFYWLIEGGWPVGVLSTLPAGGGVMVYFWTRGIKRDRMECLIDGRGAWINRSINPLFPSAYFYYRYTLCVLEWGETELDRETGANEDGGERGHMAGDGASAFTVIVRHGVINQFRVGETAAGQVFFLKR